MQAHATPLEDSPFVWHDSDDEPIHDWSRPHAWLCNLDVAVEHGFDDLESLSRDEQQRAGRLKSCELQRRFIASRQVLRRVLARCLMSDPSDIQLDLGPFSKPFVAKPNNELANRLQFNLSHSEHLLLLAVTLDREVGTDIEVLREDLDWPPIAESHFTAAEIVHLKHVTDTDRSREFYCLWTRHEALAKCAGHGIVQPRTLCSTNDLFENAWSFGDTHAVSAICLAMPSILSR